MSASEIHYYDPRYVDTTSIISSNITEDDLPGPGRVLSNIYSNLGRRLEQLLSSFAERRGSGPSVVAHRISWNEFRRTFSLFGPYTRKDLERQRKDVKRLVRYVRCAKRYHSSFIGQFMLINLTDLERSLLGCRP